jgi:broad specificity phosphatase PhoE
MLLLVRHGRTELNAAGLLQGRVDPPLDAAGRAQAAALATVPRLRQATRVVCSPLQRARQTAAMLGPPVTVDERWIELDYGGWDGRPFAAVTAHEWAHWRADPAWSPPGGESLGAVGSRVRAALAHLAAEAAEADVAVVSHVSPIKAAVAWALGVGDEVAWAIHLDPASLTRIAVVGERGVVHSLNETAHLLSAQEGPAVPLPQAPGRPTG